MAKPFQHHENFDPTVYDDAHDREMRLPPTIDAALRAKNGLHSVVATTRDALETCEHPAGREAVAAVMEELEAVAGELGMTISELVREHQSPSIAPGGFGHE